MRTFLGLAVTLLAAHLGQAAAAQSTEADPNLVVQGRYLATAGDCVSCHGTNFAGGDPVPSPIGQIYAKNITPDIKTGIGSWTLAQFSGALRQGVAPDGHLYPAMPYTSYTGLSDDQVRAIYSYLILGVKPISHKPPETNLPFPFYRSMMFFWNAFFLDEGHPTGAIDVTGKAQERGRLLVETLGHCSACHTRRGDLMQQNSNRHLAGAMVGGWWAPNITPAKSGIGGWTNDQLSTFLMTGHTDIAVAGGDMGKAVSHSLSKLSKTDIDAIVAYLNVIPAVVSGEPQKSVRSEPAPIQVAAIEPAEQVGWQGLLGHGTTQGNILYQSACASCHGVGGNGSTHLQHPSLHRIKAVTGPKDATLVQVIAHGIDRTVGDNHTFMPGFRGSMNNHQIASLANYVRSEFGGSTGSLDASQVTTILSGQVATPWLIRNAAWLTIAAIVIAILVLLVIIWAIARTCRLRHVRAA